MAKTAFLFLISFLPNFAKIAIYRFVFRADTGTGARIGFGTVIQAAEIRLGKHSSVGHFTFIKAAKVDIGSYVRIGHLTRISVHEFIAKSRSIVSSRAEIMGSVDNAESVFSMDMHSWIFPYCFVDVSRQITLGRNVGVGGGTYVFTHGYWLPSIDGFPVAYKPVVMGDDVWIPWGCFIMPGAVIGSKVIIGAKSLVSGNVPDNALFAGSPARLIREKCYKDVSTADKTAKMIELTKAFLAKEKITVQIAATENLTSFVVDGKPLFTIYTQQASPDRDGLNIVFWPCGNDVFEKTLCYSLADYKSSSYEAMPETAKKWFQYIRCEGIRFYPVDEPA